MMGTQTRNLRSPGRGPCVSRRRGGRKRFRCRDSRPRRTSGHLLPGLWYAAMAARHKDRHQAAKQHSSSPKTGEASLLRRPIPSAGRRRSSLTYVQVLRCRRSLLNLGLDRLATVGLACSGSSQGFAHAPVLHREPVVLGAQSSCTTIQRLPLEDERAGATVQSPQRPARWWPARAAGFVAPVRAGRR